MEDHLRKEQRWQYVTVSRIDSAALATIKVFFIVISRKFCLDKWLKPSQP